MTQILIKCNAGVAQLLNFGKINLSMYVFYFRTNEKI